MWIFRVNRLFRNSIRLISILLIICKHGIRNWINNNRFLRKVFDPKGKNLTTRSERLRLMIEDLGPTFVKFGQIIADRPDLVSEQLRNELKKLQTSAKPFDNAHAWRIMEDELGNPIHEVFEHLDQIPIASASIAQVYRGKLRSGEMVAVKVQRPHIKQKISIDLVLMKVLAEQVVKSYPELASFNVIEFVEDFGTIMKKELDFAKTNFISIVSHELKTPIASIKMSIQLLENKQIGSLNEEQESLVRSIKDDAGRLLKITAELLNMTQVETGSIQMAILPSSPKEMVDYAVNANKTAAENKNINLKITIPENISSVLADKDKTAWVLTNLISNAIRYSYDDSTVEINVSPEGNKVKFAVTDTGQGIAPEYIHKVFDRYFRIPGSKKEGTGLGLSISKEFIEAQDGSITVKSEFGAGSTFSFVLNKV